jgi:serine/tyrosine/threonine adenylyltransferase
VLVRLSHSHIRIGTFQRLLFLDQHENITKLLDYAIETYMPDRWRETMTERASAFLEEVCRRVARTGARWLAAGFVHGVLNTDNINITGESFDYGPWRFLPVLDPGFTAAYFDQTGLYSFGRQPDALLWNLTRLAECLLPIADRAVLESVLQGFEPVLHQEFEAAVLRRLGLQPAGAEANADLVQAFWRFLFETKAPFEQCFFDWHGGPASQERAAQSSLSSIYDSDAFAPVRAALDNFAPATSAKLDHLYFQQPTPCTMLIEEVEALWEPIAQRDDWSALEAKIAAVRSAGEAYGVAPSRAP